MSSLKPNIVLIGGGGHCLSAIDVIEQENKYNILGILDSVSINSTVLDYPILGNDSLIEELAQDKNNFFLITVGQIKSYTIRENIAHKLNEHNAKIATVISPFSYVSKHSQINEGTIVHHQCVINAGVQIGTHCIINTKANIEHGASVEDFCHISTCSVVNGDSKIKRGSFIGSNSTISNGIEIPENSIISAGKFIKRWEKNF